MARGSRAKMSARAIVGAIGLAGKANRCAAETARRNFVIRSDTLRAAIALRVEAAIVPRAEVGSAVGSSLRDPVLWDQALNE